MSKNSVPITQNPTIFCEGQGNVVSNLHVKFGFDIDLCLEFTVRKRKIRKKSFCPLVVVQKRTLGGSGDIGVVFIIGAPHPELLPNYILSRTANF